MLYYLLILYFKKQTDEIEWSKNIVRQASEMWIDSCKYCFPRYLLERIVHMPLVAVAFGLTRASFPKILVFFVYILNFFTGISDTCLTIFCSIGSNLEAQLIDWCSRKFLWEEKELQPSHPDIFIIILIVSDSTLKLKQMKFWNRLS